MKKTPISNVIKKRTSISPPSVIDALVGMVKKSLTGIEELGTTAMERIMEKLSRAAAANDLWASHLNTLPTFKCVDLNSAYRDRTLYPLQSDFVVPFSSFNRTNTNAFNASDPVSLAMPYGPYGVGTCDILTTASTIYLSNGSIIYNYYQGSIIEINGENRLITKYVTSPSIANKYVILDSPLSVAPAVGDKYIIKYAPPIVSGNSLAGATYTNIPLPNTFSDKDNYYKGMFIRFSMGNLENVTRIISSYDGTTYIATLSSPLPEIPLPQYIEIAQFSYDNNQPLIYNGSRTVQQYACYNMQLMNVSIPNKPLLGCGYNGYISDYPFIYIHFYNEPNMETNSIYSNNPGCSLATFKVAINNAASVNTVTSTFVVLDNINVAMPVTIKFCPYGNIRVKITLPNGDPIKFYLPDNSPPLAPNPLLQISLSVGLNYKQTVPVLSNFM